MKCLGALDRFIVRLFLLESVFQGVAGTVAGILTGLLLAFGEGLRIYGGTVWRLISAGRLCQFAGFCFFVGLALTVAGAIYPALRAARMQPVDAMRSEI
jgi:ABC-type lipoprotein release transport system permease subunit